jgi:hypothetical protein
MAEKKPEFESEEALVGIVKGHGPCTYLLLSLIAFILLFPYAESDIPGRMLLGVLYSLIMIGGAFVIGRSRHIAILAFVLAGLGVALQWAALFTGLVALVRLTSVVYVVVLILAIGSVLRYLLRKGPVTADKMHGALAGYIMLALLWTHIYAFLENVSPGSFSMGHTDPGDPHALYELLYFSFSTLTTVGYGDITPVTEQARSFVMIEEFAGVFFVGVLIARLAGLYPAPSK